MKPVKALIVSSLSILLCYACGDNPKSETNSNSNNLESTTTTVADEKQEFINKYNVYVDVWNSVSPSIERSYALLTNNFDETGKPRKEQQGYFVSKALSASSIQRLAKVVNENPEISELDGIGKKLVSSFEALEAPLEKLSDYLKAQSYLDDEFKISVELYPSVQKNMEAYLSASNELGFALQTIDSRLLTEELENYKKDGYEILYNRGMLIKKMKELTALFSGIEYDTYESIDFDTYDTKLKEVIAFHSSFKELSKDVPKLKKELNISIPARLTVLNSSVDKFVRQSRNLKAMANNPKEYDRMKSNVKTMGIKRAMTSHIKVIEAVEQVINQSNYLN